MQKLRMSSVFWLTVSLLVSPALLSASLVPLIPAPEAFSQAKPTTTEKSIKLKKSYYHFEGVPVDLAPLPILPKTDDSAAAKISRAFASATTTSITPLCDTLATGTSYTLNGTATGEAYCYHFQITQRAKTTVYLVGQNINTDFALSLLRHETDGTLTSLATSDQPGNTDEGVIALTEPGDYYWYMEANVSDGSAFQFGAYVNAQADDNELNDSVALSTPFPAGQSSLEGSMDSAQDVDYFHYEATSGQDLILRFSDTYDQNEWIAEYFSGTSWVAFAANQTIAFSGLPSPFTLHIRVYPSPNVTVNPRHTYSLLAGAQVTASDMGSADTTENLVRLGLSDWSPYLTTQAHNEMNWRLRVLDSAGNPVSGAMVRFRYQTEDIPFSIDTAISGASGIASGTVTLPDCSGNNSVIHTSGGNTWRTTFDEGRWDIKVDYADPTEVGVGGENYPVVVLGHICTQTLQ